MQKAIRLETKKPSYTQSVSDWAFCCVDFNNANGALLKNAMIKSKYRLYI